MKRKIPVYTENRTIDTSKVQEMCVRYNFYTRGDNGAYTAMFNMCRDYNGVNEQEVLEKIASDIVNHSDMEELVDYGLENEMETIAWIMGMIIRDCTWIRYDSEEREIDCRR